jgi:hypothetical protein
VSSPGWAARAGAAMGNTMKLSQVLRVGLVAAAACVTLGGCLVSAPPPAAAVAYEEEEPAYVDGYQVHFDVSGLPFIYVGRTVQYVPRSHPRYYALSRGGHRRYRHYRY